MRFLWLILPLSAAWGCSKSVDLDADGDGVVAENDCDDMDPSVHPGATETCNGLDDNCDGQVDEGVMLTFFADEDGDGYGSDVSIPSCSLPEGAAEASDDCDDADASRHPEADERCNAIDDDCDGDVDEGAIDASVFYTDADADGFGDPEAPIEACEAPTGAVSDDTDCDDDASSTFPGSPELCNDVDDDCDGSVDEEADDAPTWYADTDGDTYGDPGVTVTQCDAPEGYVANADDCDDAQELAYTGADEVCDEVDNDCDGTVDNDDALDALMWYGDADGDGYGNAAFERTACEQPADYVDNAGDCDDTEELAYTGATEVCDEVDNDCDGTVDNDDAADADTWYADTDADGYGDPDVSTTACEQPESYVANATDCDDDEVLAYTGAVEVCDEVDNDCDGTADNDDAVDADTWYADTDSDGYGDPDASKTACEQPSAYVENSDDCDDTEELAYTGADEVCDEVDNDCDGTVDNDDAIDAETWYADSDGDGYGDANVSRRACDAPSGYLDDDTDCDDTAARVSPAADEVCDGVDTDCDASTSEDGMVSHVDGAGVYTDLSSSFSGTASGPVSVDLSDDGEVLFCDGTYYVNLDVGASVALRSVGSGAVLDGGGSGSVVHVDGTGLTVSLADLILQNGSGDAECLGGDDTECGGGLACEGDTTTEVTVDSCEITGNEASRGGGISDAGCLVSLEDTTVSDSVASIGGGIWTDGGNLTLVDSAVRGNEASVGGGLVDFNLLGSTTPVHLDGSLVSDNSATRAAGAWIISSTLSCDGSASTAGFLSNTSSASDADALLLGGSLTSFEGTDCEFGTATNGDDNDTFDLGTGSRSYRVDGSASFTCSDGACGSVTAVDVGGASVAPNYTTQLFGNVIDVDTTVTLDTIEASVSSSSCLADLYLMSNTSESASGWTVEFAETGLSATGGVVESETVGLVLEAGTHYLVAVGTRCGASSFGMDFAYDTGASTDAGFGSTSSYAYDGSYTSKLAVGDTYSADGLYDGFGAGIFGQTLNFTEL